MRTKLASVLLMSILALGSFMTAIAFIAAAPVQASSGFDGTYDFTTSSSAGSYTEHSFLTISSDQISNAYVASLYHPSNWPAGVTPSGSRGDGIFWYTFIGTVDSSGHASWRGGCVLAAGNFDYTYTGTIYTDGTGSGTYSGNEHGTWSVQKSSSSSIGLSAAGGMAPVVSGIVIVIAIVAIAIASTPVRSGFRPQVMSAPSPQTQYEPSVQTTTDNGLPIGPPEAGTPVGGAGLQYATPAPVGKPLPPRDHFTRVSQNPPRCPIHGDIALSPRFTSAEDAGSWFCPRCNGYPWGKN